MTDDLVARLQRGCALDPSCDSEKRQGADEIARLASDNERLLALCGGRQRVVELDGYKPIDFDEVCARVSAHEYQALDLEIIVGFAQCAFDEIARLREVVQWDGLETTTCWHRRGDFRVTWKGGGECPHCAENRALREKLEKARTLAETKLLEFLQTHNITLINLNAETMVQRFGIDLIEALRKIEEPDDE